MLKEIRINWNKINKDDKLKIVFNKYYKYLLSEGFRPSTIENYTNYLSRYLRLTETSHPSQEVYDKFFVEMLEKHQAQKTINNYTAAVNKFFQLYDMKLEFKLLKSNKRLPHYFNQDDVESIFGVIRNIKHLAMFKVLFYGCLRSSELCSLNDQDLDLKKRIVFIRDGKCGKDGIALLSNDCIDTLRDYLDLRPPLILDNGESPLFYTDWGNRFTRWKIYLFSKYKAKAGVKTHGEVHVFGRHTPATLMIENGADISIAQRLLRHNDIRTTLQYVHLSDKFCREKYDECLKI